MEHALDTVINYNKAENPNSASFKSGPFVHMEPLLSVASILVLVACSKHVYKQDDVRQ